MDSNQSNIFNETLNSSQYQPTFLLDELLTLKTKTEELEDRPMYSDDYKIKLERINPLTEFLNNRQFHRMLRLREYQFRIFHKYARNHVRIFNLTNNIKRTKRELKRFERIGILKERNEEKLTNLKEPVERLQKKLNKLFYKKVRILKRKYRRISLAIEKNNDHYIHLAYHVEDFIDRIREWGYHLMN